MGLEKIIVLDTNSIIYRVYHALPFFQSPEGIPTNALYGLTNIILKIIEDFKPQYIFACYDTPGPTIRHIKYKEYKAQRPKIADDLKIQIDWSKKILKAFNIKVLTRAGYEADDLIGTIVEKFKDKEIIIISGDLDTLQLVNENTRVYFLKKGIREIEIYDLDKVLEKYNLEPIRLVDFKALIGDPSDNIIGLKGVGEKTALNLLKKYNSLEKIIELAEKNLLFDKRLQKLILENKERLLLNKELAKINKDVDIEITLEIYQGFNQQELISLLQQLGFRSIIERLIKNNKLAIKSSQELFSQKEFFSQLGEISPIIYLIVENDFVFLKSSGKFYKLEIKRDVLKEILQADLIVAFNLKEFFKKFYLFFDPEVKIEKFFDLKIAFWLVSPLNKITLEKILSYYYPYLVTPQVDLIPLFLEKVEAIFEDLKDKIEFYSLKNILEIDQKVDIILGLAETEGILVDRERLKNFKQQLLEKIKKIKEEIYQITGFPFNLNSPIELRKVLFEKLKIPSAGLKKTPKGEISTSESELLKIKDKHLIIEKILIYRTMSKILNSFLENLMQFINSHNKIKANFEITGTSTGRITSEKPNLQNLPLEGELGKELRKCFVAKPNFSFLSFDYSQIELRICAHLSKDENLINIFKQNLDVHSITAKLLFKEENEKTRRLAKIVNFGIIYGISPKGLHERTGLSLSQSKELIEKYFQTFPGVKKMIHDLIEKAKSLGYTETILGRKRFVPELFSKSYNEVLKGERIAINTPIQGLAADINKIALIKIFDFVKEYNYQNLVMILLQIHDEIILEVSDDIIELIKEKVKNIMGNVIKLEVPLVVKIKKGKNLAEIQ